MNLKDSSPYGLDRSLRFDDLSESQGLPDGARSSSAPVPHSVLRAASVVVHRRIRSDSYPSFQTSPAATRKQDPHRSGRCRHYRPWRASLTLIVALASRVSSGMQTMRPLGISSNLASLSISLQVGSRSFYGTTRVVSVRVSCATAEDVSVQGSSQTHEVFDRGWSIRVNSFAADFWCLAFLLSVRLWSS